MTTTADHIQALSDALDNDVTSAQERANLAVENLRLAQEECEAADKAIVELHKQRDGFRRAFAPVLGIEVQEEIPEPPAEETESRSLKLVPALEASNDKPRARRPKVDPELSSRTQKEQLRYLLGTKTMTVSELREALEAHNLTVPSNLASLLNKHKAVFSSPSRGCWRVTDPDDSEYTPGEVLTEEETQVEVRDRLPAARRQY